MKVQSRTVELFVRKVPTNIAERSDPRAPIPRKMGSRPRLLTNSILRRCRRRHPPISTSTPGRRNRLRFFQRPPTGILRRRHQAGLSRPSHVVNHPTRPMTGLPLVVPRAGFIEGKPMCRELGVQCFAVSETRVNQHLDHYRILYEGYFTSSGDSGSVCGIS